MAKEFEIKKIENPAFFEKIWCRECQSTEDLMAHKFSDIVMCCSCVNDLLTKAGEEDEKEGYYTDNSYAELIQERNS